MILYLDALHVLSANVKDTVNIGIEKGRGVVMSNGLNLAFVQVEGGFEQKLTVACGAGMDDIRPLGKLLGNLLHGADRSHQRACVVVVVK